MLSAKPIIQAVPTGAATEVHSGEAAWDVTRDLAIVFIAVSAITGAAHDAYKSAESCEVRERSAYSNNEGSLEPALDSSTSWKELEQSRRSSGVTAL